MSQRRFAIVLAGCGNKDGAEIHESVLTLLSIDRAGHSYQCFAPDVAQGRVMNFVTNEETSEKRNVLQEAARIARGNIKPLSQYRQEDFDILVLPGGFGVAFNLCTFAKDGANMTVNADVSKAVTSTHAAGKPIGAWCIAPVIIAKLIPQTEVTFGRDANVNAAARQMGAKTSDTGPRDIIIDRAHRVVTTSCYMHGDARVSELAEGIDRGVKALLELL